jgi:hypothetical protein
MNKEVKTGAVGGASAAAKGNKILSPGEAERKRRRKELLKKFNEAQQNFKEAKKKKDKLKKKLEQ